MASISVQAADFDLTAEADRLTSRRLDVGALVIFTGLCRDEAGALVALEIEHYSGMAEAEIARVAAEAEARWPLIGLRVIHRYGRIEPGQRIMMVAVAASHRAAAFEAADFMMDFLKTSAPFWKREHRTNGQVGAWVEAKSTDEVAARRWT